MEEKKITNLGLELVRQPDIFKIIIPTGVEKKIRFLCSNIWDVEWSGVLFYKIEGSFEDKSLVVRCVDLFQMDIGSSAYTEFKMSPDVATYIVDHPELTEDGVYQGLIHSHNNMPTFFSGTDINTLKSEGSDMAHFVSLIVNNAGKYSAGITRKCKSTQIISKDYTYLTWGGKVEKGAETFKVENEKLEWFDMDIIFEGQINDFEEEMMDRIKSIEESKKKVVTPTLQTCPTKNLGRVNLTKDRTDIIPMDYKYWEEREREKMCEDVVFSKDKEVSFSNEGDLDVPYGIITVDPSIVQSVVKQLVTSSIIISNESAIKAEKWANSMESLYRRRFGSIKEFEPFASNYVDYLINYTYDSAVMEEIDNDESFMAAILAWDVREALKKLPSNPWLNVYIRLMDDYII